MPTGSGDNENVELTKNEAFDNHIVFMCVCIYVCIYAYICSNRFATAAPSWRCRSSKTQKALTNAENSCRNFANAKKTSKLFPTFSWVKWSTRVNCSALCLLKTHVRNTQLAVWHIFHGNATCGTVLSRKKVAYCEVIFSGHRGCPLPPFLLFLDIGSSFTFEPRGTTLPPFLLH